MTLHLDGIDGLRSGIIFYAGWRTEEKAKGGKWKKQSRN
jgi:hypothetical protein